MVGDNAVPVWVTHVDLAAVRNTQNLDILVRRSDLSVITTALEGAGFMPMKLNSFRDKNRTQLRDFLA